jgi:ribonuclease P/MRP protein subunit POP5
MKTKSLSPTLREQKRYLVYEVVSKAKIDESSSISSSITNHMRDFVGTLGLGEAGLIFLNNKYNKELQRGIVRVENHYLDKLRASLLYIEKIENKNVIVRSVGASGVLNKAINKYLSGTKNNIKKNKKTNSDNICA